MQFRLSIICLELGVEIQFLRIPPNYVVGFFLFVCFLFCCWFGICFFYWFLLNLDFNFYLTKIFLDINIRHKAATDGNNHRNISCNYLHIKPTQEQLKLLIHRYHNVSTVLPLPNIL